MVTMLRPEGGRIKVLRIQRGWPQEQLARIADISPRTVQRLEAGGNASFETLRSIACAFEVDVHELLHGHTGSDGTAVKKGLSPRVILINAAAWLISKLSPFTPALKTALGSAAVVLLVALAIRLSPFLVNLDPAHEIPHFAPASRVTTPVAPAAEKTSGRGQMGLGFSSRPSGVQRTKQEAPPPKERIVVAPVAISADQLPFPQVPSLAKPEEAKLAPGSRNSGAPPAIAGTVDIDWLAGLADPGPAENKQTGKPPSGEADAQDLLKIASSTESERPALVGRGATEGPGPVTRSIIWSGKSTASFFVKVGSSIKRAF